MRTASLRAVIFLFCTLIQSHIGFCQSDPSNFDAIINVPANIVPSTLGSNTQLNILDGGALASSADSPYLVGAADGSITNVEVNVIGGTVGDEFVANDGSIVNVIEGVVGDSFRTNLGGDVHISGGAIGDFFYSDRGSQVSITGGSIGTLARAGNGSHVLITGGTIGRNFNVSPSSTVEMRGGTIGRRLTINTGRPFTLFGGEFFLDGVKFAGRTIPSGGPHILTGTLEDGSPFIFGADHLRGLNLQRTSVPTYDTTPIVVADGISPPGLRTGQAMTLLPGGSLGDNFATVNASLTIHGGIVGNGLEVSGSTVEMLDGQIAGSLDIYRNSSVDMLGGLIEGGVTAFSGSTFSIADGVINSLLAYDGSDVHVSGGTILHSVSVRPDSTMTISGGTIEGINRSFFSYPRSTINISGGRVKKNIIKGCCDPEKNTINLSGGILAGIGGVFMSSSSDVNISGGEITGSVYVTRDSTISVTGGWVRGTLAGRDDVNTSISGGRVGRVESFDRSHTHISGGAVGQIRSSKEASVLISGGAFQLDGVPVVGLESIGDSTVFDLPFNSLFTGFYSDGTPFAISYNDADTIASGTLSLELTEVQPAVGTSFTVPGDAPPLGIRRGQTLTLEEGGELGDNFIASAGSAVVVTGGIVGRNLEAVEAHVSIFGGNATRGIDVFNGSILDIFGGEIAHAGGGSDRDRGIDIFSGGTVNIYGGTFGRDIDAYLGSELNLFGTHFELGGVDITSTLQSKVPHLIDERDTILTGTLVDGSSFSINLHSSNSGDIGDFVSSDALLTVRLAMIPEPSAIGLILASAGLIAISGRRHELTNFNLS